MTDPVDPLPRTVAEIDQAAEGLKLLGRPMAVLYRELRTEGLGVLEAAAMVSAYFSAAANSSEEEDDG